MNNKTTLLYVHDPMCSWCYGFNPVFTKVIEQLKNTLNVKYLLGGLAKDSDQIMPLSMQEQIQSNWLRIENTIPNITFNFKFWEICTPVRSTYPSCRAVIAAKKQHRSFESKIITAIQNAYYQDAKNPSDYLVLSELAANIGLHQQQFNIDMHSQETEVKLSQEINYSKQIGASSFPSLYIVQNEIISPIVLDYNNADIIIEHIRSYI